MKSKVKFAKLATTPTTLAPSISSATKSTNQVNKLNDSTVCHQRAVMLCKKFIF